MFLSKVYLSSLSNTPSPSGSFSASVRSKPWSFSTLSSIPSPSLSAAVKVIEYSPVFV
ncbi:MAG: hypothetical protein ACK5HS_01985 [Mycoplasmatales bacterium]